MRVLTQIVLVALGSALGGLARWGLTVGIVRIVPTRFPLATFLINVTGSLFLGWFTTLLAERLPPGAHAWRLRADDLRLLVAVGFTGAYTTFSTFEFETHKLFGHGDRLTAATYMAGSVFLGLVAVRFGVALAKLG